LKNGFIKKSVASARLVTLYFLLFEFVQTRSNIVHRIF